MQADWDMFFGHDESPFVSRFVEWSERLARLSSAGPCADEDTRAAAARAMQGILPAFHAHKISDMAAVMRFV